MLRSSPGILWSGPRDAAVQPRGCYGLVPGAPWPQTQLMASAEALLLSLLQDLLLPVCHILRERMAIFNHHYPSFFNSSFHMAWGNINNSTQCCLFVFVFCPDEREKRRGKQKEAEIFEMSQCRCCRWRESAEVQRPMQCPFACRGVRWDVE